MKNIYIKQVLIAVISLLYSMVCLSQETTKQDFNIPLSYPDKPGMLKIHSNNGKIEVQGYDGKEVLVTMVSYFYDGNKPKSISSDRAGLKRIPNIGTTARLTEENNIVKMEGHHNKRIDFIVQVPQEFSLSLHTHHNGDIKVENVIGEIEVNGHHGGIRLDEVGGSVIANTHHGEIIGSMVSVTPNKPMAFSTYHGDIDFAFPPGMNASAKIKSTQGDMYTDFEFEVKMQEPVVKEQSNGKATNIFIDGWFYGELGDGGPEFSFNTHHGDIIIRKMGE